MLRFESRLQSVLLLAFTSPIFFLPSTASAAPTNSVEVVGVQVSTVNRNSIFALEKRAPKVSLTILANRPEGDIIGYKLEPQAFQEFKDNLGNNLLKAAGKKSEKKARAANSGLKTIAKISPDRKHLLLELSSSKLPGKKATSLIAKGSIIVETSPKLETAKINGVSLTPNTEFKVGSYKLKVAEPSQDFGGDPHNSVTFIFSGPKKALQSFELSKNSRPIRVLGFSQKERKGKQNKVSTEVTLTFAEELEKVDIQASVWPEIKEVKIPLNVTASLGL